MFPGKCNHWGHFLNELKYSIDHLTITYDVHTHYSFGHRFPPLQENTTAQRQQCYALHGQNVTLLVGKIFSVYQLQCFEV